MASKFLSSLQVCASLASSFLKFLSENKSSAATTPMTIAAKIERTKNSSLPWLANPVIVVAVGAAITAGAAVGAGTVVGAGVSALPDSVPKFAVGLGTGVVIFK